MTQELKQDYGDNPLQVRATEKYKSEYIKSFVERWDELIGWDKRAKTEGDFFIDILREYNCRKVLDVATGTGFHSIRLIEAGFKVTSADGNPNMLAKAFDNGMKRDIVLQTVKSDWRWLNRDVNEKFDAIICLGNSFTHLFSDRARRRALAEFYAVLDHNGILILDQRNYDTILDCGFKSKHIYYYCGEQVKAEPEYIDNGLARFRYEFPKGSVYHLNMFPLRQEYTRNLMQQVGFQNIKTYGDFQETYHQHETDFLIHVADKKYQAFKQENN